MQKWYGGYYLKDTEVFNASSVLKAIKENDFKIYKEIDESIIDLINHDDSFKNIIKRLLNNENIKICTRLFENDLSKIKDEDSLLTVLTHFGLLGYNEKEKTCYIPNNESKQILLNIYKNLLNNY